MSKYIPPIHFHDYPILEVSRSIPSRVSTCPRMVQQWNCRNLPCLFPRLLFLYNEPQSDKQFAWFLLGRMPESSWKRLCLQNLYRKALSKKYKNAGKASVPLEVLSNAAGIDQNKEKENSTLDSVACKRIEDWNKSIKEDVTLYEAYQIISDMIKSLQK